MPELDPPLRQVDKPGVGGRQALDPRGSAFGLRFVIDHDPVIEIGADAGEVGREHVAGSAYVQSGLPVQRRVVLDRPPPTDGLVVLDEMIGLGEAALGVDLPSGEDDLRVREDFVQAGFL